MFNLIAVCYLHFEIPLVEELINCLRREKKKNEKKKYLLNIITALIYSKGLINMMENRNYIIYKATYQFINFYGIFAAHSI